ncbi:MAG: hypothetical protein IJV17_06370 [Prevotella sp.]|nr:hypothetical protein [Prevotella sp.]
MTCLHIFNPEHDIALACNLSNFTAPHAGRQLRADLGFLSALWAEKGDYVLVEDVDQAARAYRRAMRTKDCPVNWITKQQLRTVRWRRVDPWGWDAALRHQLHRAGVKKEGLPSEDYVMMIRRLSHRITSAQLLRQLQGDGLVGEAVLCESENDIRRWAGKHPRMVLKAPWSSSGRGIRFIDGEMTDYHWGWIRNLLKTQGGVMAEPYYEKVKDFGMEFEATTEGIRFLGLSLFHTTNGAYTGNILATETVKRQMMSRYGILDLMDAVQERICGLLNLEDYIGPFGVDMMIVKSPNGFLLHPCVEINLRRTMGHVALALSPQDDHVQKVMRISYESHYKLSIRKLHYLK